MHIFHSIPTFIILFKFIPYLVHSKLLRTQYVCSHVNGVPDIHGPPLLVVYPLVVNSHFMVFDILISVTYTTVTSNALISPVGLLCSKVGMQRSVVQIGWNYFHGLDDHHNINLFSTQSNLILGD